MAWAEGILNIELICESPPQVTQFLSANLFPKSKARRSKSQIKSFSIFFPGEILILTTSLWNLENIIIHFTDTAWMFFGVKLSLKVSWLEHHRAHLHLNMEKVHNFTETRRATTARQLLFWKRHMHLCLVTIVITNPTKTPIAKSSHGARCCLVIKSPHYLRFLKPPLRYQKKIILKW